MKEESAAGGTGTTGTGSNESSTVKDEAGVNIKGSLIYLITCSENNQYIVGDDFDDEMKEQKEGIKQEKNSTGASAVVGEKKDAQAAGGTNSNATSGTTVAGTPCTATVKIEKDAKDVPKAKDIKVVESEIVRDLKAQLK